MEEFIRDCAAAGLVQIELDWKSEELGWGARIFPWETVLGMATKPGRKQRDRDDFTVVRHLSRPATEPVTQGDAVFALSKGAKDAGFDTDSERLAIGAALDQTLAPLHFVTLSELGESLAKKKPPVVHLVMLSGEDFTEFGSPVEDKELPTEVARAVASHGPALVAFSSCNTGRRFAPHAVAEGAELAIGFHGEVADASVPVFFAAFYRAWKPGRDALAALRAGLAANRALLRPRDLGIVTLWSARSLIPAVAPSSPASSSSKKDAKKSSSKRALATSGGPQPDDSESAREARPLSSADLKEALQVFCQIEKSLNYSLLHNSQGGLFERFDITKILPGRVDRIEVTVRLDTGFERPSECHFFVSLSDAAAVQRDLAEHATLPLGSQLLRQRGEILIGTVEVDVRCGDVPIFNLLQPIRIQPCDEWKDDRTGRHLLPSFIFPRDPAVREILSAAQPFLRAICDDPVAGFGGYYCEIDGKPVNLAEAAKLQTRAIWAALQSVWRIDYASPPPAYALSSQRLRTPAEILRARRATCIELALLLASCWEHIDIHPVIFLTTGHAFTGYWADDDAANSFAAGLEKMLQAAQPKESEASASADAGVRESRVREEWMLAEPHHLTAIRDAVRRGRLIPVEATYIPKQKPFARATEYAATLPRNLRRPDKGLRPQIRRHARRPHRPQKGRHPARPPQRGPARLTQRFLPPRKTPPPPNHACNTFPRRSPSRSGVDHPRLPRRRQRPRRGRPARHPRNETRPRQLPGNQRSRPARHRGDRTKTPNATASPTRPRSETTW